MKKLWLVLLVVILGLALVACGNGSTNDTLADSSNNASDGTSNDTTDKNNHTPSSEGQIGNFYCKINDAIFINSYDGVSCIVVSYDFTNNSDSAISAWGALYPQAFQNGIELESKYIGETLPEGWNDDNEDKQIKTGATITCCKGFALDDSSDVEVEISEFLGFSDDVVTKTFSVPTE